MKPRESCFSLFCALALSSITSHGAESELRLRSGRGPDDYWVLHEYTEETGYRPPYFGWYSMGGLSGHRLHLFPNSQFAITFYGDISPERSSAVGTYTVKGNGLPRQSLHSFLQWSTSTGPSVCRIFARR